MSITAKWVWKNRENKYKSIYDLVHKYSMKKKGFTLLEVIIAITSFFLLLVIILNIYTKMMNIKYTIQAKTNTTQEAYFTLEKINLLLKEYTIDYEEYFNRKNVWCDTQILPFTRDKGENGYCDNPTGYGNKSNINNITSNTHTIYFCSSALNEDTPYKVIQNSNIQNGSWCINTGKQSFGQYYRQFRDAKKDSDSIPGAYNDDDDENIMKWPSAIEDIRQTQELYLISQDKTSRIFIRRALIESGDWNNDWFISGDNEKLYTLQILKLKWFDAGNNHNFDINNSSGVYDGNIDTWACDYSQWFICNGNNIGTLYSDYKIPTDQNDGRTNLFQKSITISDWNISISPSKNPNYAKAEEKVQINPYFTIQLTTKLYGKIRKKRLGIANIDKFQTHIQTTFNTKNWYTK